MPRVFAGACPSPPRTEGEWNFTSSSRPWPSGVSTIAYSDPDALEPDHAVHPTALDLPLSLQLESEFDEERRRGLEVVDHDAHVLHALDRHALDGSGATAPAKSYARAYLM